MKNIWLQSYPQDISQKLTYLETSVFSILKQTSESFPQNPAVIFYNQILTYKSLLEQVNKFSASLHKIGIKKGDRVAVFLPNCPQSLIAFYAILKLGAVVVTVNPLYVERELAHQLNDSGAKALIYLDLLSQKVKNVQSEVATQIYIQTSLKDYLSFPLNILLDMKMFFSGPKKAVIKGAYRFLNLLNEKENQPEAELFPNEDLALIQYTGGTTGISKGVMLTHSNLLANVNQAKLWFCHVEVGKEVFLSVLPFFHAFGMTVCMNLPILIGASIVVLSKFQLKDTVNSLKKHKITVFPAVPSIFSAINNFPGITSTDLSSLKFCISGAAALPSDVMKKFETITGSKLVEGFGMTEASPITHCNPLYGKRKEGSIGLPLPNTVCKIVDLDNRKKELKTGEIGELVILGPQVMKGYWNTDDKKNLTLVDGWLYTGDIAKMDEEGYFYIVDRKKDMIISGGFNIYPRELEEVLCHHPKVSEAAVIGIDDDYYGEVPKAFVVLKKGYMASETEIVEFCRANLAKYKIPKQVEFTSELPKNILGKVLRRKVREKL